MTEEHALPQNTPAPEDALAACQREREEYLAGWQRARADFLNYKKEEAARLAEVAHYANAELLTECIGILDSFSLGLAALEKSGPVEKGIYMIRAQTEDILRRHGLHKIPIRAGDLFDPAIAESVAEVEGTGPPGSIVEEIEAGYRLHEKIIRPARVIVVKITASQSKDETQK